ncbi:Catalase [Blattella germanica]|nr:Catalase [Blattella germanica]
MLTVGPRGYMLTQDITGFDILARFTRERTPERSHFTKGAGAFGYFEVTNDITKYTKAVLFSKVGKRTKIGVRFSIMNSLPGTPDMVFNEELCDALLSVDIPVNKLNNITLRNFLEKYTRRSIPNVFTIRKLNIQKSYDKCNDHICDELKDSKIWISIDETMDSLGRHEGIWDLLGYHITSIFSDSVVSHTYLCRKNPVTDVSTIRLFGNEGTPDGYRHMNGHAINTFTMINKEGTAIFVKFHWLTDQGIKYLTSEEASEHIQAARDYSIRDLYNAIALKNCPSWTLYIQVMDTKHAEQYKYNPFDSYREWPRREFPYIEVGKLILTENPKNYFAEVEQIAFNPAHMGRLLLYTLAHQHRLGTNYLQIPVNKPFHHGVSNYHRDGMAVMDNQGDCPNYYPNSFNGPERDQSAAFSIFHISGDVSR